MEIDPKATILRPTGKRTPFTRGDIEAMLERIARRPDGTYRVVAGRLIPGKILGRYRYQGTRPDDPNDVVPHEHRRELRALRVFGAWTNVTDFKAANTLDTLLSENGHDRQTLSSGRGLDASACATICTNGISAGSTSIRADRPWQRLFSFGFALSPWQTVDYVEYPSIGKFEGDVSIRGTWRPQTPTNAYMEMRDDDAFWAARRVAAFTDDMIRAVVHTGEFSDPAAEKAIWRRR